MEDLSLALGKALCQETFAAGKLGQISLASLQLSSRESGNRVPRIPTNQNFKTKSKIQISIEISRIL